VGDTVRRPAGENARLVRALLEHLHERGIDGVPRYLGSDERGRETFTFLPGDVPSDLDPAIPDETLAAAARLIRRFHDATAGSALAANREVVCHNDLSPCNVVFRDGVPVGIIDFDAAAPGDRLDDLGMALFLWLNLGTDGQQPMEQARRIDRFCRAYGSEPSPAVIEGIIVAVRENTERLRTDGRIGAARWWQDQLEWLECHRHELV
jgi:hypothetical protein